MSIQSVLFSFSLLFYILLFYYFNMVFKAISNLESTPDKILTVKMSPIFSRRPKNYYFIDFGMHHLPDMLDILIFLRLSAGSGYNRYRGRVRSKSMLFSKFVLESAHHLIKVFHSDWLKNIQSNK